MQGVAYPKALQKLVEIENKEGSQRSPGSWLRVRIFNFFVLGFLLCVMSDGSNNGPIPTYNGTLRCSYKWYPSVFFVG